MGNLLKLEFCKLKKQKSFYVCILIMVALLFLSALTTKVLINASPELAGQFAGSAVDSLVNALGNSSFIMIVGIFTALTVCEDYEQQTVKTIFARGYSRKMVYFAKMISVFISTSIMFIIVEAAAFAFGTIYFGVGELGNFKFLGIVAVQYIITMANVALFFAISSVLRKNGSSIAATIVAPMIVNMVLSLADSLLKFENFSMTSAWLSSFLSDVSTLAVGGERIAVCLAASLVYIAVFAVAGLHFNKKTEL